jgi:hypothetical protein
MKTKQSKLHELHEKIEKGLDLSFKKLILLKKRNNGVFAFSKNGQIVEVKAKDLEH